ILRQMHVRVAARPGSQPPETAFIGVISRAKLSDGQRQTVVFYRRAIFRDLRRNSKSRQLLIITGSRFTNANRGRKARFFFNNFVFWKVSIYGRWATIPPTIFTTRLKRLSSHLPI